MNTVPVFTNYEDAEKLAIILIRAEVDYEVEKYDDDTDHGFLFTLIERGEENDLYAGDDRDA